MLTTSRRRSKIGGSCCAVAPALRAHHDRLLRVDTDAEELLDLLELALTWGELDYSEVPVLGPDQWLDFASQHKWCSPDRAHRIFSLATDVARSSTSAIAGARSRNVLTLLADAAAS